MSPISNPKGVFLKIEKYSKLVVFSAALFPILHDLQRSCSHTNMLVSTSRCLVWPENAIYSISPLGLTYTQVYYYFISQAGG